MGISTDALLCFGIDLETEGQPPEWLGTDENGDSRDWYEYVYAQNNIDWSDKNYDTRQKVIAEHPAYLVTHCSVDYPMHILAVNGFRYRAPRGDPAHLLNAELEPPKPDQLQKFMAFARSIGCTSTPNWLLCSYMG